MDRNCWLDLFTGTTWDEFYKNGASVSGFKERRRNIAKKIHPGDYLLCYLTGLSRFIGVLEVLSESYFDETPIWKDQLFPIRFKVKVIYALNAKTAIPVHNLKDKLSIFSDIKTPKAWTGFFRGSPVQFNQKDAEVIIDAVKDATAKPVEREFDERKYWRSPKVFKSTNVGSVTIPDKEEVTAEEPETEVIRETHEEMQWLLLKLGSDMGLDVWVARNDRNKQFNDVLFNTIPNLRKDLPRQFDEATNRTIELIDVLWLQKDAILAAFEVEHTTSIYSGLLRMSDLLSMQPNINIKLRNYPFTARSGSKTISLVSPVYFFDCASFWVKCPHSKKRNTLQKVVLFSYHMYCI